MTQSRADSKVLAISFKEIIHHDSFYHQCGNYMILGAWVETDKSYQASTKMRNCQCNHLELK
jgi:hypothetical protein